VSAIAITLVALQAVPVTAIGAGVAPVAGLRTRPSSA
jgi:hypothetical protein